MHLVSYGIKMALGLTVWMFDTKARIVLVRSSYDDWWMMVQVRVHGEKDDWTNDSFKIVEDFPDTSCICPAILIVTAWGRLQATTYKLRRRSGTDQHV